MLISLAIAFMITPWLALKLAPKHAGTRPRARSRSTGGSSRRFARLLTPFVDPRPRRPAAARCSASASSWRSCCRCRSRRPARRAEDAAVRQQERVPGRRRPAGRLAGRGDGGGAGRAGARTRARSTRSPTSRPTPAPPRRSTSTASSASTTCGSSPSRATCRSTWSTASIARARATRSRWRCARRWRRSAPRHKAKVKVVEVPPGPPVLSPIVAEIYGPDEAGRHAFAKALRAGFVQRRPTSSASTTRSRTTAPRLRRARRPAQGGAGRDRAGRRRARRCARRSPATTSTSLHDGQAKYGVPVRLTLPPERQGRLDALLAMTVRERRRRGACRSSELVRGQAGAARDDALPQGPAAGDLRDRRHGRRHRQPALRDVRHARPARLESRCPTAAALDEHFISQRRRTRTAATRIKWDGEWQVTYETFRDMGIAYARRPDADLPAGGRAVRLLRDAAGHHGADPADHHRRDARPRAARHSRSRRRR